MAADGMEYNIVFPEAATSESRWKGTKEPVVILLGWAGCKNRHLSKYSDIYNKQGCVTICYTAPLKSVFILESFGYKELRTTALKLLELLFDYEVENSPIFFHVFSNGGFMLYRYIAELLESQPQFETLSVIGTVVDSAPDSGNVLGAVRALKATLGTKLHPVLTFVLLSLFAATIFVLRVLLYPLTKYIHKNHFDAVQETPPVWPHFYLFSRADQVIRHSSIRSFMETTMRKGVSVDSYDFITSAHVSHFREFPEQYTSMCLNFLNACMKETEGTQVKRRLRMEDQ